MVLLATLRTKLSYMWREKAMTCSGCEERRSYLKHYGSTLLHKFWVAYNMAHLYKHIDVPLLPWAWRAIRHDWTKFTPEQARDFSAMIATIGQYEYGSQEYKDNTNRPGVKLHVRSEDHHPQYWIPSADKLVLGERTFGVADGYKLMSTIAKHEMICDWAAATRRNASGGDIMKSIGINAKRFYIDLAWHAEFRIVARLLSDLPLNRGRI